jgi:hypothetical protein
MEMQYRTKRDLPANLWGVQATIPKGSVVIHVTGAGGGFAIADAKLLERLSGNTHDPKYRYVWIDEQEVEPA